MKVDEMVARRVVMKVGMMAACLVLSKVERKAVMKVWKLVAH